MSKFKVGDKVRVLNEGTAIRHYLVVGSLATVKSVEDGERYLLSGISRNHGGQTVQTVSSNDLGPAKEPAPTNIKSETDPILGSITVTDAKESNVLFMAHLYHGLGMSFRQVAKLTNVHERTVRRRFKKYGIPSRPMNGVK